MRLNVEKSARRFHSLAQLQPPDLNPDLMGRTRLQLNVSSMKLLLVWQGPRVSG
jgi:hypothetical protein